MSLPLRYWILLEAGFHFVWLDATLPFQHWQRAMDFHCSTWAEWQKLKELPNKRPWNRIRVYFFLVNHLPISCCLFLKKSRNVLRTWLLVQNEEWRRWQYDRWVEKFFREIRFICRFTDNTEKLCNNESFSFFSVFLCGLFMFTFWMLQRQRHLLFIICATLVAAVKST